MRIASPKSFWLSLIFLGLGILQLNMAMQWLNSAPTRDFDFGPGILLVLVGLQILVALTGIAISLRKK